jgi:hypothetical protein
MQPIIVGWMTKRGARRPDVLLKDEKGASPQYVGESSDALVTEGKDRSVTAAILRGADK